MKKNIIAFKKGLVVCPNDSLDNREYVTNLQHFLMGYGYILTEKAFEELSKADLSYLEIFQSDIQEYLNDVVGTVKAKKLSELTDRLGSDVYTSLQSLVDLIWIGESNEDIEDIYEHKKFNKLDYASEDKFKKIFTKLVQINTALVPTDFKIVEYFANEYGQDNIMPKEIPFKENLCMLASLGLDVPVKSATDVLRIATYLSNGTTDLIIPPKMIRTSSWSSSMSLNPDRDKSKFKKFKRSERRYLLSLLDKVADSSEMVLRLGMWLRLGEILHPGEYTKRFPKAAKAFKELRNTKVKSWYGYVDSMFEKSFEDGINTLSKRAGEFARRLDSLIRNNYGEDRELVIKTFKSIGHKVSSKVLWELYSHFESRTESYERKVYIKGARSATKLPTLKPLSDSIVEDVQSTIMKIFYENFQKLDTLGSVYIDEELKKIPLPTNMRTLQESTQVAIRGTRIPLEVDKKVLRAYIHWTSGVDLDLSINFIDEKGNECVCSYGNTRPHNSILHSGDVIPSVDGNWAEYIDVDFKSVPYRYGLITVRNFAGGSLEDVGARVGFMERDSKNSSLTWSPKTVTNSTKLSSKGSNVNLLIIDFKEKEWILVDEDVSGIPVEMRGNINKYIESLCSEPKVSVYDILKMHTEARGKLVTEQEEAETTFMFENFSTSYEDISKYML